MELRLKCGTEVESQKCKKCDFVSHSEGLNRKHRVEVHKLKETYQNLVLGYENDLNIHIEVFKATDADIVNISCDKCAFKLSSWGKL